jgi:hypothetical protein
MKALSGVLCTKDYSRRHGEVNIMLGSSFQGDSDAGDAELKKCESVGEDQLFSERPAHIVNIREFRSEDRTRGGSEIDIWMINTKLWYPPDEDGNPLDELALNIVWDVNDTGAEIREVGFLLVGEGVPI